MHPLIEPVGGSAPKFPIESRTSDMSRSSARTLSLSCPAQGSPSPSFRFISCQKYFLSEPVGGSPPKFTLETKTLTMERVSEDPLSLSCPAQGSPVPAYRLVPLSFPFSEPIGGSAPKFTLDSKLSLVERKFAHPLTLVCPAQGSPVPSYRYLHLTSTNSSTAFLRSVLGRPS